MLNNLRDSLKPTLEKLGAKFGATGLSPDFWTGVGLAFAFLSAVIYSLNNTIHNPWFNAAVFGGIALLVSGFFDMVDGQVARYAKKVTKRGGFLDSVFDKIAEVAIFAGLLVGGFAEPIWVLLAITLSLLVSYARSRAESLGIKLQGIGIGERAERLLVIAIIGMIPGLMPYAIGIVIVIAGITFVQRIIVTSKNIKED
ncbi:MAG: CDP-alcohol phosphatidyltransferase family protein [Nitrososphaeria archaeon]|nr:CDP-alcohol phosphatidyltransferase family protein [Nitrososphaeria archaeon]NDB51245.1 CDP-alcohol phosphatidyltransferase family protein [Nitrosopumilaceae archaeon]NDB88447.1 CDP-alcohol phosphatidyltransferase family protein [Nitrososphaerota archaeon]NDB47026.1 CDP-alcohol phosphatidyltransferase family protein [Nitrososphaeria archaeon]NDB92309.1 CDP-alcohol phosphatidyltransferase family protein [Nitrososphaeria archaeon]